MPAPKSVHVRPASGAVPAAWGSDVAEEMFATAQSPAAHEGDELLGKDGLHTQPGEVWSLVQRVQDGDSDAFGLIYEYFLAKFAVAEGQGAGGV